MRRPWPDRLARRDRPLGPGSAGRRRRPVTCAGRAAGRAEGLWRAGRGQRLAAGGGSASSGSLTQAEKTESPGQPLGLGWGHGSGGLEGGGDYGEGMREAYGGHAATGRAPREATWDRRREWTGPVLLRGRHYACAGGRVPCHQGSPRRIWGFRRCLSRSQLAAPLVLLPLDYAGRRDRKHVHTGRRPREGHRVPDWCRLSLDTRVTGIAGIPSRRSS